MATTGLRIVTATRSTRLTPMDALPVGLVGPRDGPDSRGTSDGEMGRVAEVTKGRANLVLRLWNISMAASLVGAFFFGLAAMGADFGQAASWAKELAGNFAGG